MPKTKLHKIEQLEGFLDRFLKSLQKNCLSLMKNVLKQWAKRVSTSLRLVAAAARDGAIQKKMFGSGIKTLLISNE